MEHIPALAAALGVLPPAHYTHVFCNRRSKLHEDGIDIGVMQTLDALAATCVHHPDDIYAVTGKFADTSTDTVHVYIASNHVEGVPNTAVERLMAVWRFVQRTSSTSDVEAIVRRHGAVAHNDQTFDRRFVAEQYRYSWPALEYLVQHNIQRVLEFLLRLTSDYKFSAAELAASPAFSGLTAEDRVVLRSLAETMTNIVQNVRLFQDGDKALEDDGDIWLLHISLTESEASVRPILNDSAPGRVLLQNIERAWIQIRQHLEHFFATVSAVRHLIRFSYDRASATYRTRALDAISVPPKTVEVAIDPTDDDIRVAAEDGYDPSGYGEYPANDFEDDFRFAVVEPITAAMYKSAQRSKVKLVKGEATTLTIQVHPECVILDIIKHNRGIIPYIGISTVCCLGCYELLEAHNRIYDKNKVFVRGSDGVMPVLWAPPKDMQQSILVHLTKVLRKEVGAAIHLVRCRRDVELLRPILDQANSAGEEEHAE